MTYDEIIEKVAESTGLHKTFVNKVYRAYWKAVKEYIETLPLKEELSDEDFQKPLLPGQIRRNIPLERRPCADAQILSGEPYAYNTPACRKAQPRS